MDKKTLYIAIFAIGVVVLFIIEPFAMGIISSGGNAPSGGSQGENASLSGFVGNAVANITVVRYEPYVIVGGNSDGVEAVKDRLVSEGIATYAVWSGESMVVSLKSSKDVPYAAGEFESANASAIATAYLSTADTVTVVDAAGRMVVAEGNSISMQIRPLYEEGSTHEASFVARVDGSQVTGLGTVSILPMVVKGIQAEAQLSSAPQASYTARVAWKDRAIAKPIALAAGAAYRERSFVYVENASKEALDIAIAGNPYVTGTQPGVISVQNGYVDSETLGLGLFQKGYAAVFPQSMATFENASNASAQALYDELRANNVSAELAIDWTARIMLPSVLEKGGKRYVGPAGGIELLVEGSGEPAANVTAMNVSVDIESAGSRITRVTAVTPA
ncbi:MAG: hypothetical protein WC717_03565 [Candidatus Micrarchaeia archaeon]|jgi:hypothetical protein